MYVMNYIGSILMGGYARIQYVYSLVNIELDREQIATKGFIAFLCSTMHIKQHTKSLPKLKNHKGSNYDAEEIIVHTKM